LKEQLTALLASTKERGTWAAGAGREVLVLLGVGWETHI